VTKGPGDIDATGRWPFDDDDVESLLTGGGTDRDELADLERFLQEVRAPHRASYPRPSDQLSQLFFEGAGPEFFDSPDTDAPDADAADRPGTGAGDRPVVTPLRPARVGARRKPVKKLAKVAMVTTTAALAITLAAAAQVLPGTQSKTTVQVSGPATAVQLGADDSVVTGTSDVSVGADVGADAGVTVQQPSTSIAGSAPTTTPPVNAQNPDALSNADLARLPAEVLRTLSPENLARLPVAILGTLPVDALARLPVYVLRTLPGDILARLSVDVLKTLPGDALARLPGEIVQMLPVDALARLPLDLLRALPADLQNSLPADVLVRLLLNPSPTSPPGSVQP